MGKNKVNPSECLWYPCHSSFDDGSEFVCNPKMCFCPIYPCGDESKGVWLLNGQFDCSECTLNHTKEFIDKYEREVKNNIQ